MDVQLSKFVVCKNSWSMPMELRRYREQEQSAKLPVNAPQYLIEYGIAHHFSHLYTGEHWCGLLV